MQVTSTRYFITLKYVEEATINRAETLFHLQLPMLCYVFSRKQDKIVYDTKKL